MNLIFALAIAAGAVFGALFRWLLALALNRVLPALPLGTLAANLIGAALMGMVMAWFASVESVPVAWRLAISTGFLGSLTTFSSFSAETVALIQRGEWAWTAAIITAHVVGSLLLTMAGYAVVHLALRP